MIGVNTLTQWRRSVVKSGGGDQGQSGQAIKLFQITPYARSMISKRSTIPVLTACRRLEKLVLPSIFDTNSSFSMTGNFQS